MKIIVSDTTSLIALDKLESLGLLGSIFDSVLLPFAVLSELEIGSSKIRERLETAGCFEFISLEDSEQLSSLRIMLDLGEAEAITLAIDRKLPILIDERKGRSIAKQLNLTVTGFAGVLILAVKKKSLKPAKAQEMLDQAIINGFRLSDALYKRISEILAELDLSQ
jgi:predicted nucleic acid-binding protein